MHPTRSRTPAPSSSPAGDRDAALYFRGNLRAAGAALEYPAGDHGGSIWDEFPHAIEYLVYAYLQKGSDDEAAAEVKRLHATAFGTHLQDGFSPGVYTGSLRTGAARLERGCVARSSRARNSRLGPFHLAGSHYALRARFGCCAPG